MFWLFKGIGMVLIMTVSAIAGFFYSSKILRQNEKIRLIYSGINRLAQRIRISNFKATKLLKVSFSEDVLCFKGEDYFIDKSNLCDEDIYLFEEFLSDFGKSDSKSEYSRAIGYASLFENRYKEMKEKNGPLCSLYRKLGILFGLFICVFLM